MKWEQLISRLKGRPANSREVYCEYWVYFPEIPVLRTEEIMTRMVAENPYHRRGNPAIAAREGMIFTDIRFHMANVLREKNVEFFRPDLMTFVNYETAHLRSLSECICLVRLKYAGFVKTGDDRHLTFLPHMALSIADLYGGTVIYDCQNPALYSSSEFGQLLGFTDSLESASFCTSVLVTEDESALCLYTAGLEKIGFSEVRCTDVPRDEIQTIRACLEQLVEDIWARREFGGSFTTQVMGQEFKMTIEHQGRESADVRWSRVLNSPPKTDTDSR